MKETKAQPAKKKGTAKTSPKKTKAATPKDGEELKAQTAAKPEGEKLKEINIKDPSLLLNRDLAWLEFNRRVLEEAEDPDTPALEKLKFISIFSSNLDEFFQARVGALARLVQAGVIDPDQSGLLPKE